MRVRKIFARWAHGFLPHRRASRMDTAFAGDGLFHDAPRDHMKCACDGARSERFSTRAAKNPLTLFRILTKQSTQFE